MPNDGEVTAIQLAGAGVNAHINFDLAVATVDTGREMGDAELDTGTRREDYAKVNDVFAERMDALLRNVLEAQAAEGQDTGGPSVGARPAHDEGRGRRPPVRLGGRHGAVAAPPPLRRPGTPRSSTMDAVAYLVGRGLLVDLPG